MLCDSGPGPQRIEGSKAVTPITRAPDRPGAGFTRRPAQAIEARAGTEAHGDLPGQGNRLSA